MDLAVRVAEALGVDAVEELTGGHQSRVFRIAELDGRPAVAKVLDASMVDRGELDVRVGVTSVLADLDPRVCRPISVGERPVLELSSVGGFEHYLVCFEFASGTPPDPAHRDDALGMGAALSRLHLSMSQLPATPLPVVDALRTVPADGRRRVESYQLLHGDFGAGNLRRSGNAFRIFDLDDCGYGPPAFDVANALYMVLFDTATQGTPETYGTFRRFFVDGYASAAGPRLPEDSLDHFIELRVRALGSWIDDLERAPIGIRTASPAWRATLRSFVSSYRRSDP